MKRLPHLKGLMLILFTGLSSCADLIDTLRKEEFNLKVSPIGKDTVMVIQNKKQASSIVFSVKGRLSDEARIEWDPDSLFLHPVTYLITKGKVKKEFGQSDYYAPKVYVRYTPLGKNNSGNLDIKVKIL